jgi:hypothetical protein
MFEDLSPGARFVIGDSYRGERPFHDVVEHDGLRMTFDGHAHDLESYARAFEAAGLLIERVREPVPEPNVEVHQPGIDRGWRIPCFLMLRLVKRRPDRSG